jgi:hypothetical protein
MRTHRKDRMSPLLTQMQRTLLATTGGRALGRARTRICTTPICAATARRQRTLAAAAGPSAAAPLVDTSDHATVLAGKTTWQLLVEAATFNFCAHGWLMDPVVRCLREERAWGRPLLSAMRQTTFRHFCGGESLEDCKQVAQQMDAAAGVRLLVDHSVEERETEADWADNLANKKVLLARCRETLGDGVGFVPVKVTALASPALLEVMAGLGRIAVSVTELMIL